MGGVSPAALAERQWQQQFDDPINIQYTSGTTGYPKGATLSHHGILNNAFFVGGHALRSPDQDRGHPGALYHCFGMVLGNLGCVTHGATMIYPSEGFDARRVLEAVARGALRQPSTACQRCSSPSWSTPTSTSST